MYEDRPRFELGYFYENLEDVKGVFGSLKSNSNRYKGQITKKNWLTKRHSTTQNSTKNRH